MRFHPITCHGHISGWRAYRSLHLHYCTLTATPHTTAQTLLFPTIVPSLVAFFLSTWHPDIRCWTIQRGNLTPHLRRRCIHFHRHLDLVSPLLCMAISARRYIRHFVGYRAPATVYYAATGFWLYRIQYVETFPATTMFTCETIVAPVGESITPPSTPVPPLSPQMPPVLTTRTITTT